MRNNKYITSLFVLLFLISASKTVFAQTTEDYKKRIAILDKNIYAYFFDSAKNLYYEHNVKAANEKPHSYLWPLCALIQAANEQEAVALNTTAMQPVVKAIEQYYNTAPPANGYQAYVSTEEHDSRFYDDNQWVAIAYIDAYNRTKQSFYLDKAKEIYRFMMTGYDTLSGGGLYWKEDEKTTKNTCSNGPGILIALQLHKITKQQNYLDTALVLYNWVNKHLQSADGLYYDNIKIPSLKIDSAIYTYNTGTMLQSTVLLYEITKDKKYLQEAQRIATAAEKHFYNNGKLPGNYWFNVVLLRGYEELYKQDHNKNRFQFFIDDAERTWKEERNSKDLIGTKDHQALIDQAAMIEIYARLIELNK